MSKELEEAIEILKNMRMGIDGIATCEKCIYTVTMKNVSEMAKIVR